MSFSIHRLLNPHDMADLSAPRPKTVKRLFALSRNTCAFPTCRTRLVDDAGSVVGEICHIRARSVGGPRYDPSQSNEQRHGFENLILMCGSHHKRVDEDELEYTVACLEEIKSQHEAGSTQTDTVSDDVVERLLEKLGRPSVITTFGDESNHAGRDLTISYTGLSVQDAIALARHSTEKAAGGLEARSSAEPGPADIADSPWNFDAVPGTAVRIFRMAWQLETWLRLMVYVELRAGHVDWEGPIKRVAQDWPPRSQVADQRLRHMATPHRVGISYLSLGELWQIAVDDKNWALFEPYFPPRKNALVRMEEVQAIRDRVAHFREPNLTDEARFRLFLQDFDQGIRGFCRRCAVKMFTGKSQADPVQALLSENWNNWGYGTELHGPSGWLYAPGAKRMNPSMHAELSAHIHRDYRHGDPAGLIYRLRIGAPSGRSINVVPFLQATKGLHSHVIHVEVLGDHDVAVTLPAVAGADETAELIAAFLDAGRNGIRPWQRSPLPPRIRFEWPEYVLWPNHPLCFYEGDEADSVLQIESC